MQEGYAEGQHSDSEECCHHHKGEQGHNEQDLNEDDDLFEHLISFLPPHLRSPDVPKKLKVEYLTKFLHQFRKRQNEEEQALRMYNEYKKTVANNFAPRNKDLYNIHKWGFVPSFLDAVESRSEENMRKILTEVHPGIYAFDMLTPEFCDALLEEIQYFEEWCIRRGLKMQRPNTMNNYGAILDDFGFEGTLNQLMQRYIVPFSAFLYPHLDVHFDSHHGFVVSYELGKDTNLAFHVDDAEVTLNVCLGKEFVGGDLYFGGVRCEFHQGTAPHPKEEFVFSHKKGQGIFHVSKHRHLAKDIRQGERHNLIMWCRSTTFRKQLEDDYKNKRHPNWCAYEGYEGDEEDD